MSKLAIEALLAGKTTPARIEAFLARHTFPIVEGTNVTVVWQGAADAVYLRHWIYGLESASALQRVPDTELWYITVDIPRMSRVEYKLDVHRGGGNVWIEDPRNPHRAQDPFGANSVILGEGYELPEWIHADPTARAGSVVPFEMKSAAFGTTRTSKVYLPARFRATRRYPLLVVHDGSDYVRFADLKIVLDNLIHRLEIPDLIAVFTDSPDRLREYANDATHAQYITEELAPAIARQYPLYDDPRQRCLMGASFGAVASFSTACRYPDYWGRLLLQSGSFAFTDIGRGNRRGPLFDRVVEFVNEYRAAPRAVSQRVFMSCGVYESLIYENRSLVPLLDATGMQVKFVEARDGHNWDNWRDRLRLGLSWLFPGPLMFVYE